MKRSEETIEDFLARNPVPSFSPLESKIQSIKLFLSGTSIEDVAKQRYVHLFPCGTMLLFI